MKCPGGDLHETCRSRIFELEEDLARRDEVNLEVLRQRDQAISERDAAVKDKERLDWLSLDQHVDSTYSFVGEDREYHYAIETDSAAKVIVRCRTLREAIDAARAAQQPADGARETGTQEEKV